MLRQKILCLSLVSPKERTVKKIRFPLHHVLICIALGLSLASGFAFVWTDYGRAQLMRMDEIQSLATVFSENEKLASLNENLRRQLQVLKLKKSRIDDYEKDLKTRLGELSTVLGSASSLGLIDEEKFLRLRKSNSAMGGAEVSPERCLNKGSECHKSKQDLTSAQKSTSEVKRDKELLQEIEAYIDLMRTMPLASPAHGEITSLFGYRFSPFGDGIRRHEGLDVAFSVGSPVYGTGDGVIVDVRRDSTYGLLVDIQHTKKVITRYAHLSRALVKVGDKVARGEVIALGGSTGRSTGPHLHYEVRINGKAVDPMRFLKLAQGLDRLLS